MTVNYTSIALFLSIYLRQHRAEKMVVDLMKLQSRTNYQQRHYILGSKGIIDGDGEVITLRECVGWQHGLN